MRFYLVLWRSVRCHHGSMRFCSSRSPVTRRAGRRCWSRSGSWWFWKHGSSPARWREGQGRLWSTDITIHCVDMMSLLVITVQISLIHCVYSLLVIIAQISLIHCVYLVSWSWLLATAMLHMHGNEPLIGVGLWQWHISSAEHQTSNTLWPWEFFFINHVLKRREVSLNPQ